MKESDPLSFVRTGYDLWANVYDTDGNPLVALEEPHMKAAIGEPRDLEVLDLGCGTGRHTMWLAAAGANVTAIDFSQNMLRQAQRKPEADKIKFLVHDLHKALPLPTGQFDLVISGLVLEHVRDLDHFFGEARRVTRSTGRFVVSAMHPAMFLRGAWARFTDPESGEKIHPGSLDHKLGDIVVAALRSGFMIEALDEYSADAKLADRCPRAEKYIGWPMLVVLALRPHLTKSGLNLAIQLAEDGPGLEDYERCSHRL